MDEIYLVTGATGFLGRAVVKELLAQGKTVIGLRLPNDKRRLFQNIHYETGDITKPYTLAKFFVHAEGRYSVMIHCAGIVSIASDGQELMRRVNVEGTKHLVDLSLRYGIDRFLYVSSVHAITENKNGAVIEETKDFSVESVEGNYGKSKAEATSYVLKSLEQGLDAVVIHPSGMIGPEDYSGSYMTETIRAFLKGCFPVAVEGGYDFADVRDVADGIIKCAERGKTGETYILSNRNITIKEMFEILSGLKGKKREYRTIPLKLLKVVAPIAEKIEKWLGLPMLITPYSLYTLGSNGHFSHEKADRELGYVARPIEDTLADTVRWMQTERKGDGWK